MTVARTKRGKREIALIAVLVFCFNLDWVVFYWKYFHPQSLVKEEESMSFRNLLRKSENDSEHENDLPLFVLHLGPDNPGRESVQSYATKNKKLLEKNDLYFLGNDFDVPFGLLGYLYQHCWHKSGKVPSDCTNQWDELQRIVNLHEQEGHTLFASENLNQFFSKKSDNEAEFWKRFQAVFKRWRVQVVVSYRRYYEEAVSSYQRQYLVGHGTDERTQPHGTSWPDEETSIPSFPAFVNTFIQSEVKHPIAILKQWEDKIPTISASLVHHDDAFPRRFLCKYHIFPEATHLCQEHQLRRAQTPSNDLLFDMLAIDAYRQGLVPKKLSRSDVVQAIQERYDKLGSARSKAWPTACISKTQSEQLFKLSLQFESNMQAADAKLSSFYLAMKHKWLFDRYKKGGKFCSLDTSKVLKEEQWQHFFADLQDRHPDAVRGTQNRNRR